jgi:hypothetical protein
MSSASDGHLHRVLTAWGKRHGPCVFKRKSARLVNQRVEPGQPKLTRTFMLETCEVAYQDGRAGRLVRAPSADKWTIEQDPDTPLGGDLKALAADPKATSPATLAQCPNLRDQLRSQGDD